jgi:lipoate-protein ligase A
LSGAAGWRWIAHGPADAAWNMAVDEALLESYAGPSPPEAPTLRLYGWSPPALSIGRGQCADSTHDPGFLRAEGIDLVRRPTGGGAVLHEHERTYAVIGRLRREPFPGGVHDTYRRVAEALVAGLRRLGVTAIIEGRDGPPSPPLGACFAATGAHEITAGARKLVGSAQLRRRGAFLQHGSILTRADPQRLARAARLPRAPAPFTDLDEQIGPTDPAAVDRALAGAFAERFETALQPGALTAEELWRATRLRAWKYLSAAWTLEGREVRTATPPGALASGAS